MDIPDSFCRATQQLFCQELDRVNDPGLSSDRPGRPNRLISEQSCFAPIRLQSS